MANILVAIPIHGGSPELSRTIEGLRHAVDRIDGGCDLLITNSGLPLEQSIEWCHDVDVVAIPNNQFWAGAVATIYKIAREKHYTAVFLLNHDCCPSETALVRLHREFSRDRNVVAHAKLVLANDVDTTWWAGSAVPPLSRLRYHGAFEERSNRIEPYATDAMMGQLMLIPIQYCRPAFLHRHLLPHYYSDSVQSIEMKNHGARLVVVPCAVGFTDQSDEHRKQKRIRPVSFRRLVMSLSRPYSQRRLISVVMGNYYHHCRSVQGIIVGIASGFGTLFKAFYEFIKYSVFR